MPGERLRLCNGCNARYPPGMIRFVRRRPSFLLRLLMLVVVAIGSVGGATASALGELHEMSHLDHPAAPHDAAGLDAGHDPDDTSARLLHALVHCGHCHGQGGVLPFALASWELPLPPSTAAPTTIDTDGRPAPLESLLRPPIQA